MSAPKLDTDTVIDRLLETMDLYGNARAEAARVLWTAPYDHDAYMAASRRCSEVARVASGLGVLRIDRVVPIESLAP